MRTVQGAALDGLRARVKALAERSGLPVRPGRAAEGGGRAPRGAAPVADRRPAVPPLGAGTPDWRTSVKESIRQTAAPALGALLRGLVRPGAQYPSAAALRARHGAGPVLVRSRSGRPVLVLLDPQDVSRFYAEPLSVLAADPPEKCRGLGPAEPAGVGCAHGELRPERRQINAGALAPGSPVHPSCGSFLTVIAEEARHLTATCTLGSDRAGHAVTRAARRIVLGDRAADDEELSGWLRQLRGGTGRATRSVYAKADARIQAYADQAGTDTLVGRAAHHADPAGALDPVGQAHQWLLAMDAIPPTLLRTLLLLGAHPAEQDTAAAEAAGRGAGGELPRLRACVRECLRLYPVVPELIRVTRAETEWRGVRYPAGTSVLLPAAFHQRDPERVPAAHVFVPGRWKNPRADQDIRMAPFSHGGGRCPGDQLGLMITAALCAEVLRGHRVGAARPALDPVGPLPATLDPHGIRLTLTRR
uniref:Cytochrome P450 n=1 Tax=Streptomyces sp. NBC_00049 TaxID=2903617 RepID=A0AAU2K040_9ACTN